LCYLTGAKPNRE